MCREDSKFAGAEQNRGLFLFSLKSYVGHNGVPNSRSQITTIATIILILVAVELSLRQFFTSIKDFHPILEDARSRNILARHVGVDALSCFVVAHLGWKARHILQDLIDATIGGKENAMPVAYEGRMFTYHPEAQRIAVFFVSYQIKNTVDTLIWDDGALFIAHHVLTLLTTWGGLLGNLHFYLIFYFGVSEISTGVLCLLANFDDEFGVVGLGDAFPIAKAIMGGLFAVLFVVFRVIIWSTISYYCGRDILNVVRGSDPRMMRHKLWFQYIFVSLSLLSLLQIIWLAQIGITAKEELGKLGYL